MAKVLRSNVKIDDEVIPAGTKMSNKVFSPSLRKQLKETGFFVNEVVEEDEADEEEPEPEEEGSDDEAPEEEATEEDGDEPEEDQDPEEE